MEGGRWRMMGWEERKRMKLSLFSLSLGGADWPMTLPWLPESLFHHNILRTHIQHHPHPSLFCLFYS